MGQNQLERQIADYIVKYKENYYRLAYSYVKNAEDALDIVQESIYKALSSVDTLKNSAYIKTWFYRIVINTSLDFLRKRKNEVLVDDQILNNYNLEVTDTYQDIDLKKAMEELPENYRTLIILRYFEDMKLEDIAETLNENLSTVKTRLYKALEKLQIKLEV
jgi:RNA polymerase sigma-70 factor, ECF subfamily